MIRTLSLTFSTSLGSKATLNIIGVKDGISNDEVNSLMDSIINDDIFEVKNKGTFVGKASADIIEKETAPVSIK